jgi:hypothetical protein
MTLARLTQPPNPDVVPCPTTPGQSQIHHCDGQYVYLSETGQLHIHEPLHGWQAHGDIGVLFK